MTKYRCIWGDGVKTFTEQELVTWMQNRADVLLRKRYPAFQSDWEDLKQEAVIAGYRALKRYEPIGDIRAYLGRCISYKIRDEALKISRYRNRVQALTDELANTEWEETSTVAADREKFIAKIMARLTAKEQKVVQMTLHGYTETEISRALKIKRSAQKKELKIIWGEISRKAKEIRR